MDVTAKPVYDVSSNQMAREKNMIRALNERLAQGLVNNLQCLAQIEALTGWTVDFNSPTNFAAPVDTPEAFAREMKRLPAEVASKVDAIRRQFVMPEDIG